MLRLTSIVVLLSLAFLTACSGSTPTTEAPSATFIPQPGVLTSPRPPEEMRLKIPALAAYTAQVQAALASDPPILLLAEEHDAPEMRLAQELAIQHPKFVEYTRDSLTGQALRTEIMSIRPAFPGDYTDKTPQCAQNQCYRVELYNYVYNATTIALVDLDNRQVVSVEHHNNVQPELNERLKDLAVQIAINAPEVLAELEAYGIYPNKDTPGMPGVKTALNGSRCERSRHLCVGPTFLLENRALWAIVDLTDGQLVGIRWTPLGERGPEDVTTERSLQNEYVMENFCQKINTLSRNGWELDYAITGSDGLEISNARYKGRAVINSAKVVDWHVSYSHQDGFGYSDAVGCPLFSTASVVAFNGPKVEELADEEGGAIGFALVQDFRSPAWPVPCNYRYHDRYEFYNDGRFRTVAVNYGRGCSNEGTYRPVMRIDLAPAAEGEGKTFAEWHNNTWQQWDSEQWQLQDEDTQYSPEGYQYKIGKTDGTGYYLEPDRGQFSNHGRGDNAYTYVTVHHQDRDEGESDMVTIGPCCNNDHQQGPEKFMEPVESLTGKDIIIWYVPQLKNDDTAGQEYCWANTVIVDGLPVIETWPCYTGPMFVPFEE